MIGVQNLTGDGSLDSALDAACEVRRCGTCGISKCLSTQYFALTKKRWFRGRCKVCDAAYAKVMRDNPSLRGSVSASGKETSEALSKAVELFEIRWGVLVNRRDTYWKKRGDEAGTLHRGGYRSVSICGTPFYAHRVAFAIAKGRWPGIGRIADHVNHVVGGTDPKRLRAVTTSANNANSYRARSTSASGLIGVIMRRSKWRGFVQIDYRTYDVGYFATAQEAGIAVAKAKLRLQKIPLVTAAKIALIAIGQEPDDGRSDRELIEAASAALELKPKESR